MHHKPWQFFADANQDGRFTITDVGLGLSQLYHLPGDLTIYICIQAAPTVATFLEWDPSNYGGWFSTIFSLFAWLFILPVALIVSLNALTPFVEIWNDASARLKENRKAREDRKWKEHRRKLGYIDDDEN